MDRIIESITARTILNSAGAETIEVTLTLDNRMKGIVSVSESISHIDEALYIVNKTIHETYTGRNVMDQEEFDRLLDAIIEASEDKDLASSVTVNVSLAYAQAMAMVQEVSLWKYLNALYNAGVKLTFPRLWVRVLEHDSYVYLLSPKTRNIEEAVQHIRDIMGKITLDPVNPIASFFKAFKDTGAEHSFEVGIDATHSKDSLEEKTKLYRMMYNLYKITYLEDPYSGDELGELTKLKESMSGCTIVSDQLTHTDVKQILELGGQFGGVLIKPHEAVTLTHLFEAIHSVQIKNLSVVLAGPEAETNDDIVADIAVAVGAEALCIGKPQGGEHVSKYNRLLQINEELKI